MPASRAICSITVLAAVLAAAASPAAVETATRIRLHREFLILATGSIGPVSGLTFVIDTGASRTMVDTEIVSRLGLHGKTVPLSVFGRERRAQEVTLHDLRIGSIAVDAIPALAYDFSQVAERFGTVVDGLVGLDMLRGRCVTIDYRARLLQWECEGGTFPESAPLALRSSHLLVDVLIDQVPVRLVPDTGAEIIAVYDRAVPPNLRQRIDGRIDGTHAAGALSLRRFIASRIALGSTLVHHRPVYVLPGGTPEEMADGVLAPRAFGMSRVQFDLRAMQLRWGLR